MIFQASSGQGPGNGTCEVLPPFNGHDLFSLWLINSSDPHKIYVDEESHNSGHGHAYEAYGIDKTHGAIVVVRPDQREYSVRRAENQC